MVSCLVCGWLRSLDVGLMIVWLGDRLASRWLIELVGQMCLWSIGWLVDFSRCVT